MTTYWRPLRPDSHHSDAPAVDYAPNQSGSAHFSTNRRLFCPVGITVIRLWVGSCVRRLIEHRVCPLYIFASAVHRCVAPDKGTQPSRVPARATVPRAAIIGSQPLSRDTANSMAVTRSAFE